MLSICTVQSRILLTFKKTSGQFEPQRRRDKIAGLDVGAADPDQALPAVSSSPVAPDDPNLDERERVIAALEAAGWVQAKAARLLGMTPRQIAYRITLPLLCGRPGRPESRQAESHRPPHYYRESEPVRSHHRGTGAGMGPAGLLRL